MTLKTSGLDWETTDILQSIIIREKKNISFYYLGKKHDKLYERKIKLYMLFVSFGEKKQKQQ